jgi:hypothetical protein
MFGEPTSSAVAEQRLRGRRGNAADPLNLIQVMLAKGFSNLQMLFLD